MCPVPIARGFVRWLQHSGETSVNDRKVKGSGLDKDLSTVPTGSCMRLGSVFDHPLFGWSNYDSNKFQTPERRNMGLGYRLFYLFALEKITTEKELFFVSRTSWGPKLSFL
ncbi:hypothetical protein AVEN_118274-1 [Araneus ventricosus]|uniref:Uncharacterized protein n=1 Tax=Araneus ventricosus TaxID=182803 RepID=A0A4Y2DXX8_ARAVE|nr:hypothetical protein AVEN_118274-1 [Araneus ventricosus]